MNMTSETLDVEIDETESLTESQPSLSGIDSNDVSSVQLISKQNATKVWDYFGFVPGNPTNFDTPTFKSCLNKITAKWADTSNLISHLRMHHPAQFNELQKAQAKQSKSRESKSAGAAAGTPTITHCFEKESMGKAQGNINLLLMLYLASLWLICCQFIWLIMMVFMN